MNDPDGDALEERLNTEAMAQMVEQRLWQEELRTEMWNRDGRQRREVAALREAFRDFLLRARDLPVDEELSAKESASRCLERFPPEADNAVFGVRVNPAASSPDRIGVDCEALRPICRSACCVILRVPLTSHEVRADRLNWDPKRPYQIAHEKGRCTYLCTNGLCRVHDDAPAGCKTFDCSKDKRIWRDFEKKILAYGLEEYLDAQAAGPGEPAVQGQPIGAEPPDYKRLAQELGDISIDEAAQFKPERP